MTNKIIDKIEQRISILLETKSPKDEIQCMCRLQKEHTPNISNSEAEDLVIQGIIEVHRDHQLDHLWYQFKNLSEESETIAA